MLEFVGPNHGVSRPEDEPLWALADPERGFTVTVLMSGWISRRVTAAPIVLEHRWF